jgi:hypothetical protein
MMALIRLESNFDVHFSSFYIKMYYNLCDGMLELAEIWNLS